MNDEDPTGGHSSARDEAPQDRMPPMVATIRGLREILLDQTRHVDLSLHLLNEDQCERSKLPTGDPDINRVIKALMHMVGISGHSLLRLTEEVGLGAKDGYPVARGIIEGAVNVAYLMASDPEVARKAQRHAEVRAYRDLNREAEMGGLQIRAGYAGQLPAADLQRLETMASEFTTAKGREKDWTDLSLRQRLDATTTAFPGTALMSLTVSAFNIYRHASEVLHGSYYGALLVWGLTVPQAKPIDRDSFRLNFLDHQFSALSSAIFAIAGMVECFSIYADIPNLKAQVDLALRRLSELPAIAETLRE